jgi:hypothetical protein
MEIKVVSQFNGLQAGARRPHVRVEWNSRSDIVPAIGTDIDGSIAGKSVATCCQGQYCNERCTEELLRRIHFFPRLLCFGFSRRNV